MVNTNHYLVYAGGAEMFILKGILRAESQEKILIYLTLNGSGYGKAISDFFGSSQNSIQKQLARMEEDGVIIGRSVGQVREFEINPRYVFIEPLLELVKKAAQAYPKEQTTALIMKRKRPRKNGKAIKAYKRDSNI